MENFASELVRCKGKLEKGDADTKVSDGIMGYLLLSRSGLAEDEIKHVLGLTGGELKMTKLRQHLVELYPTGSSRRGHRANAAWHDDGDEDEDYQDGEGQEAWAAEGEEGNEFDEERAEEEADEEWQEPQM